MLRILPREAKGRVLAALRNEGTAHDFIRDLNIKFAMAVEARYVLASLLSESGARGNVDLLPHFAVWAFNRHLLSRDSGKALQSGNQNGTGCGFGHKPVSPRPRPDLEAGVSWIVKNTIFVAGATRWISAEAVMPLMPGILISSRTISGFKNARSQSVTKSVLQNRDCSKEHIFIAYLTGTK